MTRELGPSVLVTPACVLALLGPLLVASPGCIKSVCETKSDCPVGNLCSGGACIAPCLGDTDCRSGEFCDRATGLCAAGCRDDFECAGGATCVQNQCWAVSTPADGGLDGGAPVCACLQAPRVCPEDINPASSTAEQRVCEPGEPPRPAALFFGNVGCSHCKSMFGNLLLIQSQLRSEGLDPVLVFVQLKTFTYTGEQVTSTFPTHTGPVLQDTDDDGMWDRYGADWYDVKIIDSHGCLSAFFASPETGNLFSGGKLQESGRLLEDAWRAAMGPDCHAASDAGVEAEVGP